LICWPPASWALDVAYSAFHASVFVEFWSSNSHVGTEYTPRIYRDYPVYAAKSVKKYAMVVNPIVREFLRVNVSSKVFSRDPYKQMADILKRCMGLKSIFQSGKSLKT
jgi:hypothetical protein